MSRLSSEVAKSILDAHNCARTRYGAPIMQWDWDLAADAQVHADRCGFWHATEIGKLPRGQGESLSISTGRVGTKGWVDEEQDYDCATNNCRQQPCGHWTQMLWNGSTRVGCAIQKCTQGTNAPSGQPTGKWVGAELLACRYSPPGNFRGQRPVDAGQCQQGRENRSCGNRSNFPAIPTSGRAAGVIVGKDAAQGAAAAVASKEQGLRVWQTQDAIDIRKEAADKNVPLSIVDLKQSNGQELFPWRTSKKIVRQYTPEDIKYFMDTVAPTPQKRDAANFRDVIAAMAEIERRRKKRGNIYVRADQRKLLDNLPPQHLSPLLNFVQGLPTFQHATLVDRFFEQLYKGDRGVLARVQTGQEDIASTAQEREISTAVATDGQQKSTLNSTELTQQEKTLQDRFGKVDSRTESQNKAVQARVDQGTATAEESVTSAYVVDLQAEEDGFGLVDVLLILAVALLLAIVAISVYFVIFEDKSLLEEWSELYQKAKTKVQSVLQ